MTASQGIGGSDLFGRDDQVGVSRGLAEFNAGRPVLMVQGAAARLVLPVEGLTNERLSEFAALCAPSPLRLVVTVQRARALGIETPAPVAIRLTGTNAGEILSLVGAIRAAGPLDTVPADPLAVAAIGLAKMSQGFPAVLAAEISADKAAGLDRRIVRVDAAVVQSFRDHVLRSLTVASEAKIPLNNGSMARFIIFRDVTGASSVAIIVGRPDLTKPVPVRLHSACLTGDVFGSRRCDCGDQLRLALKRLDEVGGGIVLYLAQEGRGLGLVNKMRTYQMQDDGLDTVDANITLGFNDDERDYGIAAQMLKILDCTHIVLMTNNPSKLHGLSSAGIEIEDRMPLEAPVNADNLRYMTAKAARAGHHLDYLLEAIAAPADPKGDVAPLAP